MKNKKSDNAAGKVLNLRDSRTLRQRARHAIEKGAVTSGFADKRRAVINLLNEALAAELVNVLGGKPHRTATGTHSDPIRVRASGETNHVDRLAKLIIELGGEPNFSPDGMNAPGLSAPAAVPALN